MIDTKQNKEIEFAAFVGIDWADLKHAWARRLRSEAGRMWEEAKKRFEEELLGPFGRGNGGAAS